MCVCLYVYVCVRARALSLVCLNKRKRSIIYITNFFSLLEYYVVRHTGKATSSTTM